MMIWRDDLVDYLNEFLHVHDVSDYGPMGLQVEGRSKVHKVVTGVSAHLALFEKAVERQADLILVHHGLLWDRESRVIKGIFKKRLKYLLEHDVTLLAYHLALDRHEKLGNNVLAAKGLKLRQLEPLGKIGIQGKTTSIRLQELSERVRNLFQHPLVVFPFGQDKITRIGFCSGGAPHDLSLAIEANLHAFITGEAAEPTMQMAQEAGIHFIAAGHYATEKLGIVALGRHIAKKFHLTVEFIDIENPI